MSGEGLQCFIRMCQLQPSNQPFTDQGNHVHGTGRGFCTSEVQELGRDYKNKWVAEEGAVK